MKAIERMAPSGDAVVDYDRRHLALYAALLEATDAGRTWQEAAGTILQINIGDSDAEACWRSHLERARWVVGEGLALALIAFGTRPGQAQQ